MAKKARPAGKIRDTWDLSRLYASPQDPALERDLRKIERACAAFEAKWRPRAEKLGQPKVLARALADYDELSEVSLGGGKPRHYLFLARSLATDDKAVLAAMGSADERGARAANRVEFFPLALGKLPASAKAKILKAREVSRWRHWLDGVFRGADHHLSEAEEKLSNLVSRPAAQMWEDFVDARVSALTVEWEGKQLPAEEAALKVPEIEDPEVRRELRSRVMRVLQTVAPAAEAEMNAVYAWKNTQDELRGYARPDASAYDAYEVDAKTVDVLRREVERAYPVAHRYFAAKAKLLGLPKLRLSDLAAKLPLPADVPKWQPTFPEATATLREVVAPVSARHASLLDAMLVEGRIDAHPRKGKTGGAFCAPHRGLPTYVLLNHVPTASGFMTLAHEFGHAVHSSMHGNQPPLYDGETLMVAEVASTFFESVASDAVLAKVEHPRARLAHLLERADDFIGTVFRQVAAHAYVDSLRRRVRAEGYVSAEEMARELNAAMARYQGPAVEASPEDGYTFVWWGHLRANFYFTPYAFGELVAAALHDEYRKTGDTAAFERFMEMGASARAEEIFAASGLDVTKPAFWRKGLAAFERLVEEVEAAAEGR